MFLTKSACASLLLAVVTVVQAQQPEVYVQQGPDTVPCIALSPDGRLLAAGGDVIRFYDLKERRELRTVRHSEARALAFSPDGKWLASAGKDDKPKIINDSFGEHPATVYSVRLWDVATGNLLRTIGTSDTAFHDIVFTPDGRMLAASSANPTKLYDVAGKAEPRVIQGKSSALRLAVSPDGLTLAGETYEHTIKLWDVTTAAEKSLLPGHKETIYAFRFSPDSKMLASGSYDKTIRLWNAETGRAEQTLTDTSTLRDLYFAKDGQSLLSVSGDFVRRWNLATGKAQDLFKQPSFALEVARFASDGSYVITGTYKEITVSAIGAAQSAYSFNKRGGYICALWMLNDEKAQALIAEDYASSNIWDYKVGEYVGAVERTTFCNAGIGVVSPDLKLIAMGDQGGVALFDANTRSLTHRIETGQTYLGTVNFSFSPDSHLVAAGGIDGVTKILDVTSGNVVSSITHNAPPKQIEVVPGLTVSDPGSMFPRIATRTVFSPDSTILAGSIPDGATFAPLVILWDVATGRELRRFTGHSEMVTALAFSPDGARFASGDADGVIQVWDAKTTKEIFTLAGHKGSVGALLFAPNNILVSGGSDGQIKLWDLSSGAELVSLVSINGKDWLAVTPGGLFDGSPGAWAEVLWRFSPNIYDVAPVEIFFNEYFYPNLLPDILAGKRPVAATEIKRRDRRQPLVGIVMQTPQASEGRATPSTTPSELRNVTVRLELTEAPPDRTHPMGSGVRDVRLFRNGSLVKVWRGEAALRDGKATFEATVPIVAGENRFTAYAFNRDNIKSDDAKLVLAGAAPLQRAGVAYVLAVGVDEYANSQYNLKYAVADTKAFGAEIQTQQQRLARFDRVEVAYLTDREATKANIIQALEALSKKVQPEDAVVIFFAGHGTAQENRFYLIPHDLGYTGPRDQLDRAGLQSILSHGISDEEIERAVEGIDAGQMLLVIDACNSGQALEAEEKRRGPMNSRGLAQLAYEKGMYVLTAAQSYQAAIETQQHGHGYLTYALVEEGLKTASADVEPRDGQVTLREWLDYTTRRVPDLQKEDTKSEVEELRQLEREKPAQPAPTSITPRANPLQQPRVFYRRELEITPLIVARPR